MKDHTVNCKDVCTDTDSGDDVSAADSGITSLTSYSLIVDCPSSTSSSTSGGLSPDADYLVNYFSFHLFYKNPPPSGNVIFCDRARVMCGPSHGHVAFHTLVSLILWEHFYSALRVRRYRPSRRNCSWWFLAWAKPSTRQCWPKCRPCWASVSQGSSQTKTTAAAVLL